MVGYGEATNKSIHCQNNKYHEWFDNEYLSYVQCHLSSHYWSHLTVWRNIIGGQNEWMHDFWDISRCWPTSYLLMPWCHNMGTVWWMCPRTSVTHPNYIYMCWHLIIQRHIVTHNKADIYTFTLKLIYISPKHCEICFHDWFLVILREM